ncbi:MAG: type II CAAX endopeptidase family protein [Candidatus Omnitrophica bacterium]|nr:type II CAAX endopeptidase family protein [Candidatus Omnitrophota bacterium]
MKCPNCRKDISNTAVRCRFCRKPVNSHKYEQHAASYKPFISKFINKLRQILFFGKNTGKCSWDMAEVIIFICLMVMFIFKDPFHIGRNIIHFLRLHFLIFTKEPKLFYYLNVYINTAIFKFASVILLAVIMSMRKISFRREVLGIAKMPDFRALWLPAYLTLCVVFQIIFSTNPLMPNIPFNSVFAEAKIIGNIVMIFSVLLIAPVVEEIIFRGFLFPAINKYLGIYISIVLTSVLFTLAHYHQVGNDYLFAFLLFILSLVITWAKALTKSTWFAIVLHAIYNFTCVAFGLINYLFLGY